MPLVLLALLYQAAALDALIAQLVLPAVSSGPVEVTGFSGETKEPHKPIWTTRRHLPLVKGVSVPHALLADKPVNDDATEFTAFYGSDETVAVHSFYFSSLSDRAPPLL